MSSPVGEATAPAVSTLEKKVLEIATDAFDDEKKASEWLRQPNIQLGNRLPIEVINTSEGFDAVVTVLGQIKYATFA